MVVISPCYMSSLVLCRKKEGTEPVVVGSESAPPEITKHRYYEMTSDVEFTAASQRSQVYDDDCDITTTSSTVNGG